MVEGQIVEIRPERPGDEEAIAEVNRAAFDDEYEVGIVAGIRDSEHFIPELSLVAEADGRIVGHIMFSIITLVRFDRPAEKILTLAPMSVLPAMQRKGIGSKLVRAGMEKARELGHEIVIVIGHPEYYPRFGFHPARDFGFDVGMEVPDEAFMVAGLIPDALQYSGGMVQFSPPFGIDFTGTD
jgi:putative acetyltransferase